MLHLMSSEEADYCDCVVQQLRSEIHSWNNDLFLLDDRLGDQLEPPCGIETRALVATKEQILRKRSFSAKLIEGLREVLVSPPSLESRIIGFVYRVLSFRVI